MASKLKLVKAAGKSGDMKSLQLVVAFVSNSTQIGGA